MSKILAESPDQRERPVALMLSQPTYCHQEVTIDRADLIRKLREKPWMNCLPMAY